LFKVTNLTVYSFISYISYILLSVALLYLLQIATAAFRRNRKFSFLTLKHLIIYILAVTLALVALVSVFSLSKEKRNNKVLTNNLAVERDLALEYKLRSIENAIQSDRLIGLLSFMPNGGNEVIKNRLEERYLYDLGSEYNLAVTTCESLSQLIIDFYTPPVDCYSFYQEEIQKYGTQLAPTSSFFFMNNYSGKSSYVGVFSYFNYQTYNSARLFVDIESKYTNSLIQDIISADGNKNSRYSVPENYSYAKYYNSRLAAHSGDYNFPVSIDPAQYADGYNLYYDNGRVFYINKIAGDEIISLSRERHGIFTYILFYSYLFFISAFIILIITSAFRKRTDTALPVHTFKKRITLMQIISLSAALVCVGIGTIYYVLGRNRAASEAQTDSKIEIVQSSLSEFCQYAMRYNDINSPQLFEAMDKIANNLESEINIYDTHGRLIRSTKPEIFEQFIMGSRINDEAFYNIVKKHASRHTVQEVVAGKKYLSTFAPLFNSDGILVAIVNIPFITTVSNLQEDTVLSVATIVDLYLLILIASILFGIMVANSISKPLTEVKQKISSFELNDSENKHIYYKNNNDELGVLIEAYNNMVDNLERSTRQLADQERESAWREMARQIAHEIKNPLTPMKLNLQLLMKMKQENTPGWEEKFEETGKSLLQQINILTETAEDFSSFSKFYIEDVTREDLCAILREQYNFFNTRENLRIDLETDVESAFVNVRKKQIIRTFINILSNAIQAVENNKNGKILIHLTELDRFYRVSVEDNGTGVSKKDQSSLFKPYFTTKSSGTGLGLEICRSIIEQSNGRLYYEQSETL
ncbi:MAG: GHKL domain-containing protein, partial [Bacteroidales bacterium]|nr:GHKL domain-containing protein [Bacteroidales bacterium]